MLLELLQVLVLLGDLLLELQELYRTSAGVVFARGRKRETDLLLLAVADGEVFAGFLTLGEGVTAGDQDVSFRFWGV